MMLIKCNCNHCSTHLEFERGHEGQTITCPSCGLDTKLYTPPAARAPAKELPPLSKSIADPRQAIAAPSTSLGHVRAGSCYKTLRGLIDTLQLIWIAVSLLVGLGAVGLAVVAIRSGDPIPNNVLSALVLILVSAASIVLAIAAKQAALLLVDIADCQIQAYQRQGT